MNKVAKYDVFISYSRKDKNKVSRVVKLLRERGYSVWIDTDGIESGEEFQRVIVEAIENSKLVIFFSSESSNSSRWSNKEIALAINENKYIIPIRLDSSSYNNNIKFGLIDVDYVDLTDSTNYDENIQRLLKSLGTHLNRPISHPSPISHVPVSLLDRLKNNWLSRNMVINCVLILSGIMLLMGIFIMRNIYIPLGLFGIYGIWMLLQNKEDGAIWLGGTSILWILCNAYFESASVTRFFQQSAFVSSWLPLLLTWLTLGMLFIKNKYGIPWWKQCKRISFISLVGLILCGIGWIWIIAFDTYTKLGLPHNLRLMVNRLYDFIIK